MMADDQSDQKYTAVMSRMDRERISGRSDVPDEKVYQSISRVRDRIEALEQDAEILEEHHPQLYEELQSAICEN